VEESIDQKLIREIKTDAEQAKKWGYTFMISSIMMQFLHFFQLPILGFTSMIIIIGIILMGSGIIFYFGASTIPQNREQIILRLQGVMKHHDPKRRLWASQRMIGYMKEGNFSKDELLTITREACKVVKLPLDLNKYQEYIAVDHIIFIREIAVGITMPKDTRREFKAKIKQLLKVKFLPEKAYELLADAIAYHPNKLPIQAFADYERELNNRE